MHKNNYLVIVIAWKLVQKKKREEKMNASTYNDRINMINIPRIKSNSIAKNDNNDGQGTDSEDLYDTNHVTKVGSLDETIGQTIDRNVTYGMSENEHQLFVEKKESDQEQMNEQDDDESYHSSYSDPIYPYKYAVQKQTSFYGLDDDMIDNEDTKKLNVNNFYNWKSDDILEWILSLDNGLFVEYKEILNKSLNEENLNGQNLDKVDKEDIKIWGVKDFEHRRKLYQHFQSLTSKEGK